MNETQPAQPPAWHALSTGEVCRRLDVDPAVGLSDEEAAARLERHGLNQLAEKGGRTLAGIFFDQIASVMILVLIAAAVVSAMVKEGWDWVAIAAIVLLNAVLGCVQEYRAEKAMAALKRMAAPSVRVRRGGRIADVASSDIVPGDVILLEAGASVPADSRVLESASLRVQEASLTGESHPVEKSPEPVAEKAALGDRLSLIFSGTAATYGRGVAVVVATGMGTELGRIAELLQTVKSEPTPLQKRVAGLGTFLAIAVLAVTGLMFGLGLWRGDDPREIFMTAVAVAVAAIPEGLPAVMTITLALGGQRMLRRKALIRQLPAVETLGSVTVICSDKTGTLTQNRMIVQAVDVAGHLIDLEETLRKGNPALSPGDPAMTLPPDDLDHAHVLLTGALCNDAVLREEEGGIRTAVGDPTEGAIVVAAARFGMDKAELDRIFPRLAELPFDSDRKRMTTVHDFSRSDDLCPIQGHGPLCATLSRVGYAALVKGAADEMLEVSVKAVNQGEVVEMTEALRATIRISIESQAAQGARVLGVAFKPLDALPAGASLKPEVLERDLVFQGLVSMIDPPRIEAAEAVATCRTAGIRPVMITGDHPVTAREIARRLGIVEDDRAPVHTGVELEAMSQAELEEVALKTSVYARVSPEHKLRIVKALQARGHVAAMTGDGVNDAPALRQSDIGVAMGITGTDVSKEAAKIVILDDNFATIVAAVEEGRSIYDNVRRFCRYIVTSNSGEVTLMFLAQLMSLPTPLTTLQILWMNLVTDGLPGLALGLEPSEPGVMKRPPHRPQESLFSRGMGWHIFVFGQLLMASGLGVGLWAYWRGDPAWGSMIFTTLTLGQLFQSLAERSDEESIFTMGLLGKGGNPLLLFAVISTFLLQLLLLNLPWANRIFGTHPLSLTDWLICMAASTLVFWGVEFKKLMIRRAKRAQRSSAHA